MSARLLRVLVLFALVAAVTTGYYCTSPKEKPAVVTTTGEQSQWQNVYDTTAHYVGMEKCRTCHESVYQTFIQTGMGQSFAPATKQKSAADFSPEHALVYDKDLDYYYKPYWKGDSFLIMEFRLEGKDTVHKRIEQVAYIIGSGQHTNSHIYSVNGYLYQAPITFYTQKHKWDLAPGFEKGASSRFTRLIESECMTCHNGYPDFVQNSLNKYNSVKSGIDCERCHGPGSLHVEARANNTPVDTSKMPDYTIVNPRRLSTELQNNICQRCHLQGIPVVNDGKTVFDFHPGMKLSEVMNVFMPEYEGAQDKMIMASHVERMKKSECYVVSGKMSCITCHNPHISVKFTPRTQYLNACYNCHGNTPVTADALQQTDPNKKGCTEKPELRAAKGNDCITCHMPHNGSIDIPHVAVTDHYIRKRPLSDTLKGKITAFIGLKCFNNSHTDAITTARAYLEFYERYNASRGLIDSALLYLGKQQIDEAGQKQNRDYIRAYFLLQDYGKVVQYGSQLQPAAMGDAWTAYRVGESYMQSQQPRQALPWLQRAIQIWPYALDFQVKYADCLLDLNRTDEAQKAYQFILKENPKVASANCNLGYLYMQQPSSKLLAYDYLHQSYELDPDREQTLINLAVWYHGNNDNYNAKKYLQQLLKRHPDNAQGKAMILDLVQHGQ